MDASNSRRGSATGTKVRRQRVKSQAAHFTQATGRRDDVDPDGNVAERVNGFWANVRSRRTRQGVTTRSIIDLTTFNSTLDSKRTAAKAEAHSIVRSRTSQDTLSETVFKSGSFHGFHKTISKFSTSEMTLSASDEALSNIQHTLNYDPEAIRSELVNTAHVDDIYELGEEIGAGAFGWVISATHRETGKRCAMKAQSIRDNAWCFRELEMASRVNHEYCASVLDAFVHKDKLLIVTPLYTGSDLYDYIVDEERDAFTEHDAFALCEQMLSALEACHRAGFAHLDVKPENFMFKEKSRGSDLVLVDFGSAEPFKKAQYAETQDEYVPESDDILTTLSRITGTACYMSPEVARGNFSSRSDVWSAAVCLYILMALEPPFEMTLKPGNHDDHNNSQMEQPRYQPPTNLDHPAISAMTSNGRNLMCNMMHKDPALRLSATEALQGIHTHLQYLESMGIGPVNRKK